MYPLGEFTKEVIYEIGKWLIYNFAVGKSNISGEDWGDIFSKAIDGVHLSSPVGLADVVICTWSAASGDIQAAHRMLALNKIKSLKFIVDFSFKSRKPEFCDELVKTFGGDSIRVTSCHAKFITVKSDSYNIVIRTSMNLNYNPRFENFEISDDLGLYDFMSEIVGEVWRTQADYEGINNRPSDNKRGFQRLFPCEINSAGLSDLQSAGNGDLTEAWLD